MDTSQNTALLYFTLSVEEQARAKRFTNTNNLPRNRSVAQGLINNTYSKINDIGLPVITFSSNMQVGDTFGERLSNAFAALFDKGYENVIAIGNDCPCLTSVHIDKATSSLETNDYVLGPSTDGGAYLIGAKRNAFDRDNFSELSWETDSLLLDLVLSVTKSDYSVKLLDKLSDVDNHEDLINCLQGLKESPELSFELFAEALSAILFSFESIFFARPDYFPNLLFLGTASSHRGPPGNLLYS